MIACYWQSVPACVVAAETAIVVRHGKIIDASWHSCPGHVATATYFAMEWSKIHGGSVSTTKLDIPVRKINENISTNVMITRDEHARMVLVSQGLRMSQRQYVRRAINNQVLLDELMIKERNGS